MTYIEAIKLRRLIEKASTSLTDNDALEAKELFPAWASGTTYNVGERVHYGEKLYRCEQSHTAQADWTPDVATSLFSEVGKPSQGDSPDNPIPYNNNMELFNGKYYEQNEVVYLCFRDTGIPVYNNLADLVGLYVEVVSEANDE